MEGRRKSPFGPGVGSESGPNDAVDGHDETGETESGGTSREDGGEMVR
jgi:hypothetical protein